MFNLAVIEPDHPIEVRQMPVFVGDHEDGLVKIAIDLFKELEVLRLISMRT
jgi:hypothetical protein